MKVAIINYGMGNIFSVINALEYIGAESFYTDDPSIILTADKILLPGVGSFKQAMDNIKNKNLNLVLDDAVLKRQIPILGICLGMQLLGKSSTEDRDTDGLKYFDGIVTKFDSNMGIKIPHVGFNEVNKPKDSILYNNISDRSDFYFVHSYKMTTNKIEGTAFSSYGEKFVASFEERNVFGTQFHPEKSQYNGLALLKNFIEF